VNVKLMILKLLSGVQLPLAGSHCSPCTWSPSDGALLCCGKAACGAHRGAGWIEHDRAAPVTPAQRDLRLGLEMTG
jgi:hypothetical protein